MDVKLIGISGVARVGKDTLCACLFQYLEQEFEKTGVRISLAEPLRFELNKFLISQFAISAFTTNPVEKELIRPYLLLHAKVRRSQNEKYWVERATPATEKALSKGQVPIFTDVRYPTEGNWIKSLAGGIIIHVKRLDAKGAEIQPSNSEEDFYDPIMQELATHHMTWETMASARELERTAFRKFDAIFK